MCIPLELMEDPAETDQSEAKQIPSLDVVVQSRHENRVKHLKVNQTVQVCNPMLLMETK